MNWKNASNDGLPDNGAEVLISVNGCYHLAIYSEIMKGFRLKDGSYFLISHETVYWASLDTPPGT